MKVLPAIDLINGKCVRLYQGDFSKATQVADDPEAQLQRFIDNGAEMIHIVDLDGAKAGKPVQLPLIARLCTLSSVPIEVGGGLRDLRAVKQYIDAGAGRIVLGTAAIENQNFLQQALDRYRDHIVIGVDAIDGKVATRGWETVTETEDTSFIKQMEALGVKTIIYTDISKDGTMSGPNIEAYKRLKQTTSCHIVASGGIRGMVDLRALSEIGISEAIVGKAIYDRKVVLGGSAS